MWALSKQRSGEKGRQLCSYSEDVHSEAEAQACVWYEAQAAELHLSGK